jgi:UDP-N-acetylglucosamine 2-epimerase (non-hydrolysing)
MKIFIIVGTRPEYIKLAPVYLEFQNLNKLAENEDIENAGNEVVQRSPKIIPEIKWIHTNQHDKFILSDLIEFWGIRPDYEFSLVNQGLSLAELAAKLLTEADFLFRREKPDLVIVQGDTLSAVQAALAAFYNHIKVAHVEAGLRTVNPKSPFPEELSRRVISQIADYHFCPSEKVHRRLIQEKMILKNIAIAQLNIDNPNLKLSLDLEEFAIANNIFNTGNTGIDALFKAQSIINNKNLKLGNSTIIEKNSRNELRLDAKKYILITSHRRENISNGFQATLCESIFQILQEQSRENLKKTETKFPKHCKETIEFTVCLHNNPQAKENFLKLSKKLISMNISGLNLLKSVTYCGFIQLMRNAFFIITDSGGVQEEAAYLNKYTLIMREEAERDEYLEQGLSERLNPDSKSIKLTIENIISQLMTKSLLNNSQTEIEDGKKSLYGNGDAAKKIIGNIKTAPINFT